MEQVTVTIPRGILVQGRRMKKIILRHLVGYDEQCLHEMPDSFDLNSRLSRLLERIVAFEDLNKEETRSILSKLSIGDRIAILLYTRQLLLGDVIQSTVACPKCKQSMSLELSVNSLLNMEHPEPAECYDLTACGFNLKIRPLTGFDQETPLPSSGPNDNHDNLLQGLVRSCVVHSDPPLPDLLPKSLLDAIGEKMGEVDPLSDITLTMSCPGCRHEFFKYFPVDDYILREIGLSGGAATTTTTTTAAAAAAVGESQLDREIHLLALHYHWTEKDILSIPTGRRKRYAKLANNASSIIG